MPMNTTVKTFATKEEFEAATTIQLGIIAPLQSIIEKIETNQFKESDIQFLQEKRDLFLEIAFKTLNMDLGRAMASKLPKNKKDKIVWNEHNQKKFLQDFKIILKYFDTHYGWNS